MKSLLPSNSWKIVVITVVLFVATMHRLASQTAQPSFSLKKSPGAAITDPPFYDVVSIRPVDLTKDTSGWGLALDSRHFRGYQVTASMLLWAATGITDLHRIKGVPDWASKNKYNIDAKATRNDAKALSLDEETKQAVLLEVLKSRFHYSGHYEHAESPALALIVDNGGTKHITRHIPKIGSASPNSCWTAESRPGYLKAEGCSMADLATELNVVDDRQVLDQTNLTEVYDFDLHFDNNATSFLVNGWTTPVLQEPNAEWPSLYVALPKQLGLKLKPTKALLPMLVIDHLDLPTDN